ncbi:2'-5' RNA ligase family protein [Rhodanobacter lindaniclasticus]|uniref:2'-5' RNA ligase n=1 Tax=Rhodanobacter lindaniclasticus TaxID=75310 RepID=A0A4S3KBQ5_9GAMM|nr:2'-5' RNA ligase family protein [Rhodanobacter lindaniclasticus]THD05825.1 hypothetical protein B1991_15800 [Rhodanobacter lindaniclasticus]
MAQSALIVRVPEAEAWVGSLRDRFDPSAGQGVPAHITVLYPFMPPELLSGQVLGGIRQALLPIAPFDFQLARVGRFPATTYLAPDPVAPFMELTRRLVGHFPGYLPYAGEHEEVVPHLTVAHGNAAEAAKAEVELCAALAGRGPICSTCREVVLLENSRGRWRAMQAFALSADVAG